MGSAQLTEDFKMDDVTDYGCAGRGTFDPFSPTLGKRKDHADQLFFIWKKCINCALDASVFTQVQEYCYDADTDDCCKLISGYVSA